jgi:hypothetical protein
VRSCRREGLQADCSKRLLFKKPIPYRPAIDM